MRSLYRDLMEKMLRFPKPLIAAVNGPAVAGGAGLVLACDIVVAADEATFGLPEPRRGIVAGLVVPLLVFRVGGGQAADLLLTGQLIDAAGAHRIGLFHELVDADHSLGRAANGTGRRMCQRAPKSLQLTKRLLNETIGEHLSTQLAAGAAQRHLSHDRSRRRRAGGVFGKTPAGMAVDTRRINH